VPIGAKGSSAEPLQNLKKNNDPALFYICSLLIESEFLIDGRQTFFYKRLVSSPADILLYSSVHFFLPCV
jgi:hypothetical protein